MPQNIHKLALLSLFRQHLMKQVELLGSDFSIEDHNRHIGFVDCWICVIILIQVWFWPANISESWKKKKKRFLSQSIPRENKKSCFPILYSFYHQKQLQSTVPACCLLKELLDVLGAAAMLTMNRDKCRTSLRRRLITGYLFKTQQRLALAIKTLYIQKKSTRNC